MSALPNGISSGDLEAPDEVNALLSAVKRTLAKDYDEKLQKLEDENKELKQALDGAGNAGALDETRAQLEASEMRSRMLDEELDSEKQLREKEAKASAELQARFTQLQSELSLLNSQKLHTDVDVAASKEEAAQYQSALHAETAKNNSLTHRVSKLKEELSQSKNEINHERQLRLNLSKNLEKMCDRMLSSLNGMANGVTRVTGEISAELREEMGIQQDNRKRALKDAADRREDKKKERRIEEQLEAEGGATTSTRDQKDSKDRGRSKEPEAKASSGGMSTFPATTNPPAAKGGGSSSRGMSGIKEEVPRERDVDTAAEPAAPPASTKAVAQNQGDTLQRPVETLDRRTNKKKREVLDNAEDAGTRAQEVASPFDIVAEAEPEDLDQMFLNQVQAGNEDLRNNEDAPLVEGAQPHVGANPFEKVGDNPFGAAEQDYESFDSGGLVNLDDLMMPPTFGESSINEAVGEDIDGDMDVGAVGAGVMDQLKFDADLEAAKELRRQGKTATDLAVELEQKKDRLAELEGSRKRAAEVVPDGKDDVDSTRAAKKARTEDGAEKSRDPPSRASSARREKSGEAWWEKPGGQYVRSHSPPPMKKASRKEAKEAKKAKQEHEKAANPKEEAGTTKPKDDTKNKPGKDKSAKKGTGGKGAGKKGDNGRSSHYTGSMEQCRDGANCRSFLEKKWCKFFHTKEELDAMRSERKAIVKAQKAEHKGPLGEHKGGGGGKKGGGKNGGEWWDEKGKGDVLVNKGGMGGMGDQHDPWFKGGGKDFDPFLKGKGKGDDGWWSSQGGGGGKRGYGPY